MKQEETTHAAVAKYILMAYPEVIFNSDMAGVRLTKYQASKASKLRSSRAFPDLVIYEKRHGSAGLFIELKAPGVKIYKKDGSLVANKHIQEQAEMIYRLTRRGYAATFAVGFDEARKAIDNYLRY